MKITADIARSFEHGISESTYFSYNQGKYGFGYKLSNYIVITNIFLKRNYNKKVQLECKKCGKKQITWTSEIGRGSWSVCEHDNL